MSAMVVRELFAKLGLDADMSSFKRADAALKNTEKSAFSLRDAFKYIGAAAVGAFAMSTVKAASDVSETMNVLQQSFGDNTEAVVKWAADTGKAMGRSQYQMREMAGTLGAILHPMLQNDEAAAKFSTTLSGLAVDLSSFFNTTETDALQALRAGLIGESEPLRRYGVILNDVRLKEEARTLGLYRGKGTLSAAAKAQAAYSLIMKDTAAAQGDAARTGGGYANLVRKLEGAFLDFKIAIGSVLLGPAAGFVRWLAEAAGGAADFIKQTNLLQAALIAIGAALVPFIASWVVANAPLLLAAAALTAIVLVIEDIYTAMTGGKSVIDGWFAALLGKDKWEQIKSDWVKDFDDLMDTVVSFAMRVSKLMGGVWDAIRGKKAGKGERSGAQRMLDALTGDPARTDRIIANENVKGMGQAMEAATRGESEWMDRVKAGESALSGGSRALPSTTTNNSNTRSTQINQTNTVNIQGGGPDTERAVRKALQDNTRELHRTTSGVE